MSINQPIRKPFIIEPLGKHTHTVIFLHKLNDANISDQELHGKVLAQKLTKNHKTLRDQFPTVRWVFPHAKYPSPKSTTTGSSWTTLSAQDMADLSLDAADNTPYITQIILQEARRVGGLQNVVLGGQGETALAAHDAMTALPEPDLGHSAADDATEATLGKPQQFTERILHTPYPERGIAELRMGGFLGMHAAGGKMTRDASVYHLARRGLYSQGKPVNGAVIRNTPHEFVEGGYKTQTATWDGERIDRFAEFLKEIGVYRKTYFAVTRPSAEVLTPRERPEPSKPGTEEHGPRTEQQKHIENVRQQKKRDQEARKIAVARIEENKRDRQAKLDMERMNRGLPLLPLGSPTGKEEEDQKNNASGPGGRSQRQDEGSGSKRAAATAQQQEYAEEVKRQKKEDAKIKEHILRQIEFDKLERHRRNARERQARNRDAEEPLSEARRGDDFEFKDEHGPSGGEVPSMLDRQRDQGYLDPPEREILSHRADGDDDNYYYDDDEGGEENDIDPAAAVARRKRRRELRDKPWLRWASQTVGGSEEAKPSGRGQMSEAQEKALGLRRRGGGGGAGGDEGAE
ncbi:hypothetical protein F4778DRAFT_747428 [Xylariomycetidae sp. FL2044]|nr:hypothetical protein F4778DRAFT_747428 [Xylariomycetidae sp. FL2044]